jgi:hypothetical protein
MDRGHLNDILYMHIHRSYLHNKSNRFILENDSEFNCHQQFICPSDK